MPPEGRIRLQQALDERVWLHGGSNQTRAARRVLALNKFGSKERLAQDTEIELTGFGLADDNIAAAKGQWRTCCKPLAGAIDREYAVHLAGP
jgi:hypothetical protein